MFINKVLAVLGVTSIHISSTFNIELKLICVIKESKYFCFEDKLLSLYSARSIIPSVLLSKSKYEDVIFSSI